MDSAFLAFTGTIISVLVAFAIAVMNVFSNRLTAEKLEQVKSELIHLNNKSFFKFSKAHEIQIEIIRVLSVNLNDLEKEFISEDNKGHPQDFYKALLKLTSDYNQNYLFLEQTIQQTFNQIILLNTQYLITCKDHYELMKAGPHAEDAINLNNHKNEKYDQISKKSIELKTRLEVEVKAFLTGN